MEKGHSARLEKVENMIRLINRMAGSTEGISLMDIMSEYRVCRRTAERMLNVIKAIYAAQLEEVDNGENYKAYRLQELYRQGPIKLSPQELTCLTKAVKLAERDKLSNLAHDLKALESRLKAICKHKDLLDSEYFSEIEDVGMVAGPKYKVDSELLSKIRNAVTNWQEIVVTHKLRATGEIKKFQIQPYGILYGTRPYLVAYLPEEQDYRYFCISNILKAEMTGIRFTRNEQFSLKEYAERSFGSFQEEPINVVWKVSSNRAEDAVNYQFHPSQTIERQTDGSLIVRFTAGGMKEMCWHLFTWEGDIQILEPESLKETMHHLLDKAKKSL